MIEDQIADGDLVVVESRSEARNGETVVALVGDDATLKRFYRKGSEVRLVPANEKMEEIVVPAETVTIRGEPHSVPLAIHRALAHCGYHIGQILMIARILAGDDWETITIPRGGSAEFNEQVWNQDHFQTSTDEEIVGDRTD